MIELTNIDFSYKRNVPLFRSLDLRLERKAVYGLFGRNGAGKTTLLSIMAGLLNPQKGEALLFDVRASKRLPDVLSRMFFIPESFQLPALSVSSFLSLYRPFYPLFNMDLFEDYRSKFDFPYGMLSTFSFGMKKKFYLAFALASGAELIILDEPGNALDIPSKAALRQILAGEPLKDCTVIISTHQVRDFTDVINHLLILEQGKFVLNRSMEQLKKSIHTRMVPAGASQPDRVVLHREPVPGGEVLLCRGSDDALPLDVEVLFNAVAGGVRI